MRKSVQYTTSANVLSSEKANILLCGVGEPDCRLVHGSVASEIISMVQT